MSNKEIEKASAGIAIILSETDADWRGNVLYEAGKKLKELSQGYTGELLKKIGNEYGIK